MLGSIPGAFFLKNADTTVIKMIFGIVIILIGAEMLLREFHPRPMKQSNGFTILIGVLSGILCGLYGVGALLGAYLSRVTDDSHAFKGNISVVFFIENTFRIILYSCWGIIKLDTAKQVVILLPFMLGGLGLGIFCRNTYSRAHRQENSYCFADDFWRRADLAEYIRFLVTVHG